MNDEFVIFYVFFVMNENVIFINIWGMQFYYAA